MARQSSKEDNGLRSKSGGFMARIGERFREEMEEIKKERLVRGKSKEKMGTSKITNLITRHKLWNNIKTDLINADEKEVEKYG